MKDSFIDNSVVNMGVMTEYHFSNCLAVCVLEMSKQKVNNVYNINDVFFQNLNSPQNPVVEKIYK